jgi:hypothetical protein
MRKDLAIMSISIFSVAESVKPQLRALKESFA